MSERKIGRETRYHQTPQPLQEIQDWVLYYRQYWSVRMAQLKTLLEDEK